MNLAVAAARWLHAYIEVGVQHKLVPEPAGGEFERNQNPCNRLVQPIRKPCGQPRHRGQLSGSAPVLCNAYSSENTAVDQPAAALVVCCQKSIMRSAERQVVRYSDSSPPARQRRSRHRIHRRRASAPYTTLFILTHDVLPVLSTDADVPYLQHRDLATKPHFPAIPQIPSQVSRAPPDEYRGRD